MRSVFWHEGFEALRDARNYISFLINTLQLLEKKARKLLIETDKLFAEQLSYPPRSDPLQLFGVHCRKYVNCLPYKEDRLKLYVMVEGIPLIYQSLIKVLNDILYDPQSKSTWPQDPTRAISWLHDGRMSIMNAGNKIFEIQKFLSDFNFSQVVNGSYQPSLSRVQLDERRSRLL